MHQTHSNLYNILNLGLRPNLPLTSHALEVIPIRRCRDGYY